MIKDYVKCCNCDFIGTVDIGEDICPNCKVDGALTWVDDNKQEIEEDDITVGKNMLVKIIKDEEYFSYKDFFYVTFGSYGDTDCAVIIINDKITINAVVNDNDIICIHADEVSGGEWYDIKDNQYIKECLNNIYLVLANYSSEFVGKRWGSLPKKVQEYLMSISTVWEDISEGECIVDFYKNLSISGFVINNDTDTDCNRELKIEDEAIFYNPQG